MRLDTRYIDTFLAVIEMGGISRAAEQLCITQPAVSHRIKMFEREMNLQMFERRGKRLIPTAAARRLEKICRKYMDELSAFHSESFQTNNQGRETLRIGSVSGFGRFFLFPLLCAPDFSHVRIHLTYPLAKDIFHEIEEGYYKLGFSYHKKTSHQLIFDPVYTEELIMIVSPKMNLKQADLEHLENYMNIPFITYEESDYVFGKWFDCFFKKQPRIIPSSHHFEELEEAVALVIRGDGLTILPDYTVSRQLADQEVEIIRPNQDRCFNQVYSVTPAHADPDKTISRLLESIKLKDHNRLQK